MPKKDTKTKKPAKEFRYIEGVGRRKTAVARVRIYPKEENNDFIVNDKKISEYFPLPKETQIIYDPFKIAGIKVRTTVKVGGGGKSAQAEAIRLGLSRALVESNPKLRNLLKQKGYLKRDPRMVERKKPGLRKARRPQQWRKR